MLILDLLYKLLIGPLELFFEVVYSISFRLLNDPALAIIALSLAMNLLVLPLYRRADAVQEEQRERALRMKPWNDHIHKTFSGDERFMVQQAYNRISGWSPTDTLKGSVSLLLEIPFFIAAYRFLSELELLRGVPLGPIADLGAPDALLSIGGMTINILPILMTALNLISAAIYMKGMPASNKVQMYGIAAIFLVLLYNSPAGLVFYWTLNNLFSLIKNIFYKLPNPKLVIDIMCAVIAALILVAVIILRPEMSILRVLLLFAVEAILLAPLLIRKFGGKKLRLPQLPEATKKDDRAFLLGCIFMALLTGLLVPTAVIGASPTEFVNAANYRSPLWDVLGSLALAVGTFVLWFGVFYRLATPRGRTIFGIGMLVLCAASVVNYLFFGTHYGYLSPQLEYDIPLDIGRMQMLINALVIAAIAVVLFLVWKRKRGAIRVAYACMCIAVAAASLYSIVGINGELEYVKSVAAQKANAEEPRITLSKTEKNVVIIMMDRAIGAFVPYLVHEDPHLKEQLAGFTYYPNMISFGATTNTGTPALYGGSEYRPAQLNERSEDSLEVKQNEALKVLPKMFSDNGYNTTIFDPPYAGYKWIPDITIFNDIPNVKAHITLEGSISDEEELLGVEKEEETTISSRPRNYFCYSLFRVAPVMLHNTLYDWGKYNSTDYLVSTGDFGTATLSDLLLYQYRNGPSISAGVDQYFMWSYSMLKRMPSMTDIVDGPGNLFMMSNNTTHQPMILEEPSYTPQLQVDNTEFDEAHRYRYDAEGNELFFTPEFGNKEFSKTMHYEVNMASLRVLGDWFDYLREQGVYDNTRIIIVSDHAKDLWVDRSLAMDIVDTEGNTGQRDMGTFNCLFLVKDFNSNEFITDEQFMTTADTPVLALKDIVDNPINPYTGNPIDSTYKEEPLQNVVYTHDWSPDSNNGNVFSPSYWFTVHSDARKIENWEFIDMH